MMNAQRALVSTFVVCILLIVWNEIQDNKVFPRPSRFKAAGLVFILLGIVAGLGAPGLAAAFGAGVDIALLYQFKWATKTTAQSKPPQNPPGVAGAPGNPDPGVGKAPAN